MKAENEQIMQSLKAHILEEQSAQFIPETNWGKLIETARWKNILALIGDKLINMQPQTEFSTVEM